MFGKRILILIPHPDDEVVACAATIGRARAEGAEIFALYLTHGCISRDAMWSWERKNYQGFVTKRRREAEEVAALLGITPVGWSSRPARYLWRELPPVHEKIQAAIEAHNIDQLWVPAYEGGNADHDGLNALGSVFIKQLGVIEFAEYNFFQGQAHSQTFPYPKGTEQILTLTPEEQAQKGKVLAIYKSEQRNLNYVRVGRECFRPLASYDYSQPPHPGKLWYTRFQWVPFHHPGVDFTKPEEVSQAILNFLKTE